MVSSVPTATTFTVTMDTAEVGTPVTNGGSASVLCYYNVGPSQQLGGFGWGTANYGGQANGPATTTLASSINDTVTDIPLTSSAAFPSSGEIRIGSEDISYTSNDTGTNILSGGAREVNGTTKTSHSGGATVTNISGYFSLFQSAAVVVQKKESSSSSSSSRSHIEVQEDLLFVGLLPWFFLV